MIGSVLRIRFAKSPRDNSLPMRQQLSSWQPLSTLYLCQADVGDLSSAELVWAPFPALHELQLS